MSMSSKAFFIVHCYVLLFKANVTLKLVICVFGAHRQILPKIQQLLPWRKQQEPILKAPRFVMTFWHHKLQEVTSCAVI